MKPPISHFLLMVLYALLVSVFFTLLWRRERGEQLKLFFQLFLGMVLGGLAIAWLGVVSGWRRPQALATRFAPPAEVEP